MGGVMSPGRRGGTGAIDAVLAGLQVASQVYGMKQAGEQADRLQQELELKSEEQAQIKAEKARLARGEFNPGEKAKMAVDGAAFSDTKFDGAQPHFDKDGGIVGYVGKMREPKILPKSKSFQTIVENGKPVGRYVEEGESVTPYFKPEKAEKSPSDRVIPPGGVVIEKGPDGQYREVFTATSKEGIENKKPLRERIQGLKGEERKRFDSLSMGINAVDDMAAALKDGSKTYSLVGDNPYTMSRRLWTEAIGRMQSGGAIGEDEGKQFADMAPTLGDDATMRKKKLDWLQTELASRTGGMGFDVNDLRALRKDIQKSLGLSTPTAPEKDINEIGLPGPKSTATAAPKYIPGSVVEYNGTKYTVGADGNALTEIK